MKFFHKNEVFVKTKLNCVCCFCFVSRNLGMKRLKFRYEQNFKSLATVRLWTFRIECQKNFSICSIWFFFSDFVGKSDALWSSNYLARLIYFLGSTFCHTNWQNKPFSSLFLSVGFIFFYLRLTISYLSLSPVWTGL